MISTGIIRHYSALIIILAMIFALPQYISAAEADPAVIKYTTSAHGGYNAPTKGVNRLGGYASGNCAHCHEQHGSIGGVSPQLLFSSLSNNSACTFCHDSSISNGADNIANQMVKSMAHSSGSTRYQNAYLTDTLSCEKCHDPHYAQQVPTNPPNNGTHFEALAGNKIFSLGPTTIYSGSLLSMIGVRVTSWNSGGIPVAGNEAMGLQANMQDPSLSHVDKEYELCFKCHSGQLTSGGGGNANLDVHLQFDPSHFAVHPVATEGNLWNNGHLRTTPVAFQAGSPWAANPDAQMYCSDCHGSETAGDPKGPHGSNNIFLIKGAPGPGISYDNLCTGCHNPVQPPGGTGSSTWNDTWHTGMVGDHRLFQHQWPANPLGCVACHGGRNGGLQSNIHGANYRWADYAGPGTGNYSTKFLVGGSITQNYNPGGGGGGGPGSFCMASCHTANVTTGYQYK